MYESFELLLFFCFITDIGANLTDEMFDGMYNGSRKHDADRKDVLERAWNIGVQKIVLTVGTIFDFPSAFKIANSDGKITTNIIIPI